MTTTKLNRNLKKIETSIKKIHPDNPISWEMAKHYRYLLNLKTEMR